MRTSTPRFHGVETKEIANEAGDARFVVPPLRLADYHVARLKHADDSTLPQLTHRYRKAYEDYARALHQEYPHIKFQGTTFHPGDTKMALAQVFQMCFFAGIVLAMGAKKFLPESLRAMIDEYPLPCMMLVFMCNMASGAMLNTGAFEVSGAPL